MVNLQEDIGVDGKITFKWILKTGLEGMDYRFMWLRLRINSRALDIVVMNHRIP